MRALKKVLQENPNTVTGEDLKRVERWFDENMGLDVYVTKEGAMRGVP